MAISIALFRTADWMAAQVDNALRRNHGGKIYFISTLEAH